MNKFRTFALMTLAFFGGVVGGICFDIAMEARQASPVIEDRPTIEIPGEPLRHVRVQPTLQPVEPFLSYSKEWPNGPPPVVTPFVVEFREGHWVPANEPIATAEPIPVIESSDHLPPPTVPTFVTPKVLPKPSRRTLLDRLLD